MSVFGVGNSTVFLLARVEQTFPRLVGRSYSVKVGNSDESIS